MAKTLPIRLRTIVAMLVVVAGVYAIIQAYQSVVGSSDIDSATLPIIRADKEPFRVTPENPGGAEIPNQGSKLYNILNAENTDRLALDGVTVAMDNEPELLIDDTSASSGFELPDLPKKRVESLFAQPAVVSSEPEIIEVYDMEADDEKVVLLTHDTKNRLKNKVEKILKNNDVIKDGDVDLAEKMAILPMAKPIRKKASIKAVADVKNIPIPFIKPKGRKAVKRKKSAFSLDDVFASAPVKTRHYIQLATVETENKARAVYRNIITDFPGIFDGLGVMYPKTRIPNHGELYRVQLGPLDEAEARKRCANYGGTCLVISR